jgi:hypothetical protein
MNFSGPLPGVLGATFHSETQLPAQLPNSKRLGPWAEVTPTRMLFTVPRVARYLVENGTTISIEAAPDAARSAVELFLHGSARGFLIHQRGEFALEAATLAAPNGRAVAISGTSGTGKSALAAELCRRGWSLIADDITRVTWTRGRPLAWPSHDAVKLWRDSCEGLGVDVTALQPIREGIDKFFVKMPAANAPVVLQTVIRLEFAGNVVLSEIASAQAMPALLDCSFRPRFIPAFTPQRDFEGNLRQVADACRVFALWGARGKPCEELADQILQAMS